MTFSSYTFNFFLFFDMHVFISEIILTYRYDFLLYCAQLMVEINHKNQTKIFSKKKETMIS